MLRGAGTGRKKPVRTGEVYASQIIAGVDLRRDRSCCVTLAAVPAEAESTWDQIKRTGKLRYGAVESYGRKLVTA